MTTDFERVMTSTLATIEHGWCTPQKASAMVDLIFKVQPQIVVEIGVFAGRSLIPQAMALKELGNGGVIYGLDPWRHVDTLEGNLSDADKKWWASIDLHDIHRRCMEAIWNNRLESQAIIIRSSSRYVPRLFGGGIDVLHIDGTHSEEASVRDVQLYLPMVAQGKHIWVDDTDWTTTAKAVGMLDAVCDRIDKIGSCVLFRRR